MTQPESHNLWLYLELLAKRRRLIFVIVALATLISVVVSFVLPKWYQASALLLPPKNLSAPIEGLDSWSEVVSVTSGLNLPVRATPSDVYARMLRSRTVTSRVMEQFDLIERYGESNFEEAYLELMEHADFTVSEEGLLVISAEDKDPQMAADMANAFVDELDRVNNEIVADRVNQTREFLRGRLEQVRAELDSSRRELETFQMTNKAVDFDQQTRLAIGQATALKVTLAETELQVRMSELTLGEDNSELIELQRKRAIVKGQLQQLESENVDSSFFSLPVAAIPTLKGQYEVLYSRVRVAEALYHVLLEQTERAKIKEFEKMPTISVLDRAKPPTMRSRPQRSLIVGVTFGLSVILAVFLAAVVEYFTRLKSASPDDYGRAVLFAEAFFSWLPGVKRSRRANRGGS
ncbi:MAG: hypothetical protein JSW34_03485 [Candidatus Zixiibacteriota bacterium]|nr:MAG: hypothetical protein JSW34_03485 [candidate division Zixibacteria bacterium]